MDHQRAELGDVVTYRIEVHNPTVASVSNVIVRDRLPESFHYVAGTARLTTGSGPEQKIEPETAGADLVFPGRSRAGRPRRLLYRVRIRQRARRRSGKCRDRIGNFPRWRTDRDRRRPRDRPRWRRRFSTRQQYVLVEQQGKTLRIAGGSKRRRRPHGR